MFGIGKKDNKKFKTSAIPIGGAKRLSCDEIDFDVKNGFADFGDYKITNSEVVKATKERLKTLRPDAKKFTFEEVVAEAVTSFDLLAYAKDRALKK